MRVLVETLDSVIEGEVIGGDLLDGASGGFDLESVFTVRCDDGKCFSVHGWMVDVQVLQDSTKWVM